MNILVTVFLTAIIIVNLFIISSIAVGFKGVKDRTSRAGLTALLVCLIVDVLTIAGGVTLW